MIENRPTELDSIENYRYVKEGGIEIDWSKMDDLFKIDMLNMFGLHPVENELSDLLGHVIPHQPSEEYISYFEKMNAKFQMVNVVVNLYDIKQNGVGLTGKPYSICLVPASKRGKPEYLSPSYFRNFDITWLESQAYIYLGFNPFQKGYELYGPISELFDPAQNYHTDMIGYVTDTYFLSNKWHFENIVLGDVLEGNNYINQKYKKLRIRKYYKEFKNITPRKLWGADSPIELFMIHYLASKGLYPEIQTIIFDDGSVFPSIHDMLSDNKRNEEVKMVTEVDLYFPEQKLAIFCDSNAHHRSKKAQEKDLKISKKLEEFGIKSLRLNGSDIVNNLHETANIVLGNLSI